MHTTCACLQLQEHVRALAAVTGNTKRHGAPFRHMLFYGGWPESSGWLRARVGKRHAGMLATSSGEQRGSGFWMPWIEVHRLPVD